MTPDDAPIWGRHPDDLVDDAFAVEHTGLTPRLLSNARRSGRIPYVRLGHRSVVYRVRDLHDYVTARYVPAAS